MPFLDNIAAQLRPGGLFFMSTPDVGSLAMANAGPGTAGSQFFICQMPQPQLVGQYTLFGNMVSGFDVLTRVEKGDPILDVKITEIKK